MVWGPDNGGPAAPLLLIGGEFHGVGALGADHLAAWDGLAWHTVGPISPQNFGWVNSLAVYHGELIVAGSFSSFGNQPITNVARWNGANWLPLSGDIQWAGQSSAYGLCVYNDELYVGGLIIRAGGVQTQGIAAWNGSSWRALGSGVSGGISSFPTAGAMIVFHGELIVGGRFAVAGGTYSENIARWDGTSWHGFGEGAIYGPNNGVYDLLVVDDRLIAVGGFWRIEGVSAMNVAAWDGSFWSPLGSGVGTTGPFTIEYAICGAVFHDQLIVGGYFQGSMNRRNIARWNGSTWQSLGVGIETGGVYSGVRSLAVYDDRLVATGYIESAGGMVMHGLAEWGCPSCYANCDSSSTPPVLNVGDFVCFLNQFAAGASYSNCDGSTAQPTLNVNDFVCFLNRFASGCS